MLPSARTIFLWAKTKGKSFIEFIFLAEFKQGKIGNTEEEKRSEAQQTFQSMTTTGISFKE